MSEPLISVRNLTARYGSEVILDQLNFDIARGEIVAILGGSGCGKTTLIRHLIGLQKPSAGNIHIENIDITACDEATFHRTLRKIGVLFQGGALFGSMTIAENIALPITEYTDFPKAIIPDIVRLKLCSVGLSGFGNHLPSEISGGMKKRAGLARALALTPRILFLDEPSAGLDPVTAAEMDELILSINQTVGATMVIVTHELESVFRIAGRVIMLDKSVKGIIAQGNPLELKENSKVPLVKRFFNRQTMGAP